MQIQLLPFGLIIHLSGITMMVGTFFAAAFTDQRVWSATHEKDRVWLSGRARLRLSRLQMIGGLAILLGGILMMVAVHGAFMRQTWFKVKMSILVLLILNTLIVARPAAKRMKRLLATGAAQNDPAMIRARWRLMFFYMLQLALFLSIFVLSAYKLN